MILIQNLDGVIWIQVKEFYMMIIMDYRTDIPNFFNFNRFIFLRKMPNVREIRSCREVVLRSKSANSRETIIVAKFLCSLFGRFPSGKTFPPGTRYHATQGRCRFAFAHPCVGVVFALMRINARSLPPFFK